VEQQLLSSIRILIADDYEGWRRQVRSLFQARPEWQVMAEAVDGPEAIQKAEELKPDLIVLDIGLPKLNGIEDARRELVLAVDVVLRGKQFVSSSLEGNEFTDSSGEKSPHRHEVLFYSDDTVLLDSVTRFIAAALKAGNAAIVLATQSHRDGLRQRLKAEGVDTDVALQQGTYISLDAADTLSSIMVNDMPDAPRFFEVVSDLIEAAAKAAKSEQPQVVVFGEAVALLLAEGKPDAAIRLEQLWDDVGKTFEVDILHGYAFSSFHNEEDEHVFQSICAGHSARLFSVR